MQYIFIFLAAGIAGWVIDSGYRSALAGKATSGNYLTIPFSPIYAFGALLILLIHFFIQDLPSVGRFLIYSLVLALFEALSGFFCITILKRKLWDYSNGFLNIGGQTDVVHAVYWGTLAMIFEYMYRLFF